MRIDASAAFAAPARFCYPWSAPHMHRDFTPDDLHRILARNRFEGVILRAITSDQTEETGWLVEMKRTHPWILGVVGDPTAGASAVTATLDTFESAAASDLPVDLFVATHQLLDLRSRISTHPTALANMAGATYAPGEFEMWSRGLLPLAALSNLHIKVSGLINLAGPQGWNAALYSPYIQFLMTHFGPDRLMYGSDWPYCMVTGTWKEHLAAFTQALGAQTQQTRDKLLGGTAKRFYRIAP